MLNSTIIDNLNNFKPESSHVVRHGSVIIDTVHSQAFLFGESGMSKRFIRKDSIAPLCACGCGERVKRSQTYKGWNKFIIGHHTRKCNFFKQFEKPPFCKCGCGKQVKWDKWDNKWYTFINGHQSIGRKVCQKTREKISIARKGQIPSKETCKKMSASRMGNKHPLFGKHRSKETCEKLSIINMGKKLSEETCEKMSIAHMEENHWNWKGGISCKPYCDIWLDEEYKDNIRKRDNYECQNPYCYGKFNPKRILSIHHIDGNKMNCHPWNLITICCGCNTRAEGNKNIPRIWWQNLYQSIMAEKYGYKYFL